MASILYFGTDDRIPKIISGYFEDRKKSQNEVNTLIHAKTEKDIADSLVGMVFEVIFFEHKFLPKTPIEFLKGFKKAQPSFVGKAILVGDEGDRQKVFQFLENGWTDYLHLPPDRPLLLEKLELYARGSRASERQLYSLSMYQSIDVATPSMMEELSEFGCKIKSANDYPIDSLVAIYSKALSASGEDMVSALCRCYKTEKHASGEGFFSISLNFVAVTPDILQNIRNHLRKVYSAAKAKSN